MKKILIFIAGFISCLVMLAALFFILGGANITVTEEKSATTAVSDTGNTKASISELTPEAFLKLKDNFSKPTIVNFWASWCVPCKKEIPMLQKYCSEKGYGLIFISADRNNEKQKALLQGAMRSLDMNHTYLIKNSATFSLTNSEALKAFLKGIRINDYPGGIPYMVFYSTNHGRPVSFLGFEG